MAAKHNIPPRSFEDRFFTLPRELRDLVYADVFSDTAPIPFEHVQTSLASLSFLASGKDVRNMTPEVVEAFYTHGTFKLSVSEPLPGQSNCTIGGSMFPQYEKNIRNLVVYAEEAILGPGTSLEDLEQSCLAGGLEKRARWEALLQLSRLEQLTVRFQKQGNDRLCWADFTPVLLQLRERLPNLQVSFNVSFDTLLERYWSDPFWVNNTQPGNVVQPPYDPMGFVDVTELIGPPSEDDFAYVQEHLSHDKETYGRDILRGLLDETASQRRALAVHYIVKEPALLRVRIMEHYEVYKKMKGGA